MIIPLVTIEYACKHIYIATGDVEQRLDLLSKLTAATFMVMNHVKLKTIPDEWLSDERFDGDDRPDEYLIRLPMSSDSPPVTPGPYVNVPGEIEIAIILAAGELFMNRESSTAQPLSEAVLNVLSTYRAPTLGMSDRVGFEEELAAESE